MCCVVKVCQKIGWLLWLMTKIIESCDRGGPVWTFVFSLLQEVRIVRVRRTQNAAEQNG
jgi:hypothetical protein